MSVDQSAFRAVLGRFATGVTVVTAVDRRGRDVGMTVSAFSSVSLEPPLVMICIGHEASAYAALSKATSFTVNILSSTQEAIARRFADPERNRFERLAYERGENGAIMLSDALACIECNVVDRHEAGDHDIIIGSVEVVKWAEGRPLLYYRGGYAQLER
jgi:flavin reductase (DIM6/NTAB) family NADH-FMN oxidoreductase RutF